MSRAFEGSDLTKLSSRPLFVAQAASSLPRRMVAVSLGLSALLAASYVLFYVLFVIVGGMEDRMIVGGLIGGAVVAVWNVRDAWGARTNEVHADRIRITGDALVREVQFEQCRGFVHQGSSLAPRWWLKALGISRKGLIRPLGGPKRAFWYPQNSDEFLTAADHAYQAWLASQPT